MKKTIGNSSLFYKRYKRLQSRSNKTPRVPRRYKGEAPQHHSDRLYRSKKITYAHLRQIGITMEQRSRFHAHPTPGIRAGHSVWKHWNRSFLNKNYYRHSSKMAKHTSRRKRSHRRKLHSRYDEAETGMMEDHPSYQPEMDDEQDYQPTELSLSLYRPKSNKRSRRGSKKSKRSRRGSKKSKKTKRSRRGSKKSRRKSKRSKKH
jgi:hypothetical protein